MISSGRCHGPGSEDFAEALFRLSGALATDSRDWGRDSLDAWLWGLLCGWDCEDHLVWPDHEHDEHCADGGAMREVAARHGWSDDDVARLRRYRLALLVSTCAASSQVASEDPQVASNPDPMRGWVSRLFDRLFGRTT